MLDEKIIYVLSGLIIYIYIYSIINISDIFQISNYIDRLDCCLSYDSAWGLDVLNSCLTCRLSR